MTPNRNRTHCVTEPPTATQTISTKQWLTGGREVVVVVVFNPPPLEIPKF
jgi:hypothetical protein